MTPRIAPLNPVSTDTPEMDPMDALAQMLASTDWIGEALDVGGDLIFSDVRSSPGERLTHALAIPENYEPNYAYPLIVWLHPDGRNEMDACRWLSAISPQNYVGLGLRGPNPDEGEPTRRYSWPQRAAASSLAGPVRDAIDEAAETVNLNAKRVFIAGSREGGSLAVELGLMYPEWFAGVIAVDPTPLRERRLFARYRAAREQNVFLGNGVTATSETGQTVRHLATLMDSAGMAIETHCSTASEQRQKEMARTIDGWVMRTMQSVR
ncbi:hypothetical protein Mal4_51070 [Maioricimonas rarisocia]|uniref:Alpha/beta hydrolase family protein n=1 Tax=Maioricimonas rarisocia TaxID=2528026 RepID=A0A517ZE45_9PLAN|nr:hypothetical protein [Maioricimonas rarisocia]QDU40747.1 hypothetical protein Mal4_51070 [Maioricimonas rarisocia]